MAKGHDGRPAEGDAEQENPGEGAVGDIPRYLFIGLELEDRAAVLQRDSNSTKPWGGKNRKNGFAT